MENVSNPMGPLGQQLLMPFQEKPHACEVCSKAFSRKQALKIHNLIHHKARVHKCRKCRPSFLQKETLVEQGVVHARGKPYDAQPCPVMHNHVQPSLKMYSHVHPVHLTHTETKFYECEVCNRTFRHKSFLEAHLLSHTRKAKLSKSELGKTSFLLEEAAELFREYAARKSHVCRVCGASVSKGALMHLKENPDLCEVCNEALQQQKTIKMRIDLLTEKLNKM